MFTLVFCFSLAWGQTKIKGAQAIKVMTYNVHHCNPPSAGDKIDVPAIARVINDQKPDLVALQEIDVNTERSGKGVNQAKELAVLTGMYFAFGKAIDHQGGDYGVAILSKFPIVDSSRIPLPIPDGVKGEPRTLLTVTVEVAKKKRLVFACTHLDLKEETRVSQSRLIVNHLSTVKDPIVIGGDFNALIGGQSIGYLDTFFQRSCAECAPTIPVENPRRTIDFIMHRNGKKSKLSPISTVVIDEKYASDHLPVVVEYEWR